MDFRDLRLDESALLPNHSLHRWQWGGWWRRGELALDLFESLVHVLQGADCFNDNLRSILAIDIDIVAGQNPSLRV